MRHKVLIRHCDRYDPALIAGIVREGMEELGVRPAGRVLLKPNVVLAERTFFPYPFTRSEFLEGVIMATREVAGDVRELAVGERSGITIPTRYCFENAGYPPILKKHRVKTYYFDESKQVPFSLSGEENLRDLIFVPKPIAECDFLINLPKFKAHPWTRLTLSLKNYIGLQDDRHRLLDHNTFLEHKIADLNDVIRPGFIAMDAITAGQKMMLTPTPFHMGAIVMGINPCAVDTVCCHMVSVDPHDLIHLAMASRRGLGPMDLNEIEVGGDFPLDEVRERTKNFEFCLKRIDDDFNTTSNIRCTVGTFPEPHSRDYCWGGCPGALQEAMHILQAFQPDVRKAIGKIRYVAGAVDGPLDLEKDEKVIFAGACASWRGTIDGREVNIKNLYETRDKTDARKTKSNDMLLKTGKAFLNCATSWGRRYLRAPDCPVSVADHVNYLAFLGGVDNPNFDRRLVFPITAAYARMRVNRAWNRLFG